MHDRVCAPGHVVGYSLRPTNPPGAPIATTPSQIKTVIKTGGTHGLGSEMTKALIDAGHRVVIDMAQWADCEQATPLWTLQA